MRWWSSDFHMGHWNVIRYCERPFKDINHMHEAIIGRWNFLVSENDEMYFLGDFSMSQGYLWTLNRFNFSKMTWILGNHDKEKRILKEMEDGGQLFHLRDKITVLSEPQLIDINGKTFCVVHRPMSTDNIHPTLCGHVHEKWETMQPGMTIREHSRSRPPSEKVLNVPILNVGVDVNCFYPINDEQILRYFDD